MFPQIIRSTQLDTPCLQQSRNERKRATIVCFLKKYYKARAQTFLTRSTLLGFHANGRNIVALRFVGHITIEILGLVAPKVWPVSNLTQQVPTLLWFHANGRIKSQHCSAQQCCVLLANNVASVYIGLCKTFGRSWRTVSGLQFHSQTPSVCFHRFQVHLTVNFCFSKKIYTVCKGSGMPWNWVETVTSRSNECKQSDKKNPISDSFKFKAISRFTSSWCQQFSNCRCFNLCL